MLTESSEICAVMSVDRVKISQRMTAKGSVGSVIPVLPLHVPVSPVSATMRGHRHH